MADRYYLDDLFSNLYGHWGGMEQFKSKICFALRGVVIIVISLLIGGATLFLVYSIPTSNMRVNALASGAVFEKKEMDLKYGISIILHWIITQTH